MNIEVMAWSSFIAGISTFIAVKALSWLPMSIRLMVWFLGLSLMGFAMIYGVAAYDPKMTKQATVVAAWLMLATRIAVPILAVWIVCKWGSRAIMTAIMASLLTTACGNHVEDNPKLSFLVMGMLIGIFAWMLLESIGNLVNMLGRESYGYSEETDSFVG